MKIIKIIFFVFIIINNAYANEDFENWLNSFTKTALDQGISQETVSIVLKNAKFLPNVIKYDRYQPEFYEDTKTYIGKRVTNKRINNGNIELTFLEPFYHNNLKINDNQMMEEIHNKIEQWIKAEPSQWFWQHKRFS